MADWVILEFLLGKNQRIKRKIIYSLFNVRIQITFMNIGYGVGTVDTKSVSGTTSTSKISTIYSGPGVYSGYCYFADIVNKS